MENLDHITHFQVILAIAVAANWIHTLPPRSQVVPEWIIEGLSHFMAPRRHVLETVQKEAGREPAGIVQHVKPRKISILGYSRLLVIGVVADDAAIVDVAIQEQYGVVEKEGGNIVRGSVTCQFSGADGVLLSKG